MIDGVNRKIFLAALVLALPVAASACRGPSREFEESLAKAKLVFVGRIAAVTPIVTRSSGKKEELVEIAFDVERAWKGRLGKTVKIWSAVHSCGFANGGYRGIGEKWLILASGDPQASTSMLSGNVMLELEDRRPTGNEIPKSLKSRLGKGKAP